MKPETNATPKITIPVNHSPEIFHSGKRLNRIRKMRGYTQEGLLYEPDFPKVSLKTLRRWEQKGVNPLRLQEVGSFFGLDLWAFLENNIGEEEFKALVLHPEMFLPLKTKYLNKIKQEPIAFEQQQWNQTQYNSLVELIQNEQDKNFKTQVKKFPINYQGQQGWTLLLWAVHKDQITIVNFLLKNKDIEPMLPDQKGFTALMCAATWGRIQTTNLLIAQKEVVKEINRTDYLGWSALTWACSNGHPKVAEILLQAGASPSTQDHQLTTPLHRAVVENNLKIVSVLIHYEADTTIVNDNNQTPKKLAEQMKNKALLDLFL